jgi:predicted dienelactone hydrolase
VPLATNLHLYLDAPIVADGLKRPLVMFSHGAGGNASGYVWFGEFMASHGYLVAMVYHYRANTYDTSALYLRSRLWQRPRDISLDLSQLLQDKNWGPHIDPNQIGVAGHSQGGFTSLWLGGAAVNPDLFLAFQRGWKNNKMVPAYLRDQMLPDAEPARDLRDERVKAAFAMAPGDLPGFGMDEAGLRQMKIPTYLIVGASDTSTPPPRTTRRSRRNLSRAPSSTSCPVQSIMKSSAMNATSSDATTFPPPASTRPGSTGPGCTNISARRRWSSSIRIWGCIVRA